VRPLFDDRGHRLLLEADPTRLEQILSNLLSNAAKYTPGPGTIDLSITRDGSQAVIRVRDNGIGIHPDMLDRIFELFTQSDASPRVSRRASASVSPWCGASPS
jgi:signal transduction histidine kinase